MRHRDWSMARFDSFEASDASDRAFYKSLTPEQRLDVLLELIQLSVEELTTPNRVVQLGRVPNRIDLVTSISGVSFDSAWSSRVEGTLDGIPVPFLGRDALLTNKRASGRPKDLADIAALDPPGNLC